MTSAHCLPSLDSEECAMKLESFWQATAPPFHGAAQGSLPSHADVVVIGG
ncbi:MAG TPA: FAD-dependent oxidoreductase, partial [Pantoea sp.]|nr:FAD-dependent oxidoreductase [Pantoea sp.]